MERENFVNIKTIFLLFLLPFISCEKETAPNLPTISEIEYQVGHGEVVFTWDFPQHKDVEYVRIEFISEGEIKQYSFSRYAEEAIIHSLSAKEYTFTIRASDKNGNNSEPTYVKATPLEPAYEIAARTLILEPVIGGVAITWINTTGKDIRINVEYLDNDGVKKTFSDTSSDENGRRVITDVSSEEQIFHYYTSNPKNLIQISDIQSKTITPFSEVKFDDRDKWIVLNYSSALAGLGPELVFDGDVQLYWNTGMGLGTFPHHIEFDMTSARIVTKLGFWSRQHQNSNNNPEELVVEGSLDGISWEEYGRFNDYPTTIDSEISYSLEDAPTVRYLRMTFDKPRNNFTVLGLAEIYVYGVYIE